ncbi:MAG: hypothetical protein HYU97_02595 [Deltaproteobacteria bacterium]|nr:hypothetical protein [Deltaproteobacteria bacterium]
MTSPAILNDLRLFLQGFVPSENETDLVNPLTLFTQGQRDTFYVSDQDSRAFNLCLPTNSAPFCPKLLQTFGRSESIHSSLREVLSSINVNTALPKVATYTWTEFGQDFARAISSMDIDIEGITMQPGARYPEVYGRDQETIPKEYKKPLKNSVRFEENTTATWHLELRREEGKPSASVVVFNVLYSKPLHNFLFCDLSIAGFYGYDEAALRLTQPIEYTGLLRDRSKTPGAFRYKFFKFGEVIPPMPSNNYGIRFLPVIGGSGCGIPVAGGVIVALQKAFSGRKLFLDPWMPAFGNNRKKDYASIKEGGPLTESIRYGSLSRIPADFIRQMSWIWDGTNNETSDRSLFYNPNIQDKDRIPLPHPQYYRCPHDEAADLERVKSLLPKKLFDSQKVGDPDYYQSQQAEYNDRKRLGLKLPHHVQFEAIEKKYYGSLAEQEAHKKSDLEKLPRKPFDPEHKGDSEYFQSMELELKARNELGLKYPYALRPRLLNEKYYRCPHDEAEDRQRLGGKLPYEARFIPSPVRPGELQTEARPLFDFTTAQRAVFKILLLGQKIRTPFGTVSFQEGSSLDVRFTRDPQTGLRTFECEGLKIGPSLLELGAYTIESEGVEIESLKLGNYSFFNSDGDGLEQATLDIKGFKAKQLKIWDSQGRLIFDLGKPGVSLEHLSLQNDSETHKKTLQLRKLKVGPVEIQVGKTSLHFQGAKEGRQETIEQIHFQETTEGLSGDISGIHFSELSLSSNEVGVLNIKGPYLEALSLYFGFKKEGGSFQMSIPELRIGGRSKFLKSNLEDSFVHNANLYFSKQESRFSGDFRLHFTGIETSPLDFGIPRMYLLPKLSNVVIEGPAQFLLSPGGGELAKPRDSIETLRLTAQFEDTILIHRPNITARQKIHKKNRNVQPTAIRANATLSIADIRQISMERRMDKGKVVLDPNTGIIDVTKVDIGPLRVSDIKGEATVWLDTFIWTLYPVQFNPLGGDDHDADLPKVSELIAHLPPEEQAVLARGDFLRIERIQFDRKEKKPIIRLGEVLLKLHEGKNPHRPLGRQFLMVGAQRITIDPKGWPILDMGDTPIYFKARINAQDRGGVPIFDSHGPYRPYKSKR